MLTIHLHDRLDSVSPADWNALFPRHPDSLHMVRLTQNAGMDGFAFRSLVVRDGERPVLLLPLFDVRFDLAELAGQTVGRLLRRVTRLAPGFLSPRVLGVGFVEGEWGEIGFRRDLDASSAAAAWE